MHEQTALLTVAPTGTEMERTVTVLLSCPQPWSTTGVPVGMITSDVSLVAPNSASHRK